jgi:hypothetical protein
MNNFIKQVIEEKFVSKKQQRFFYAKAGDKSSPKKERKQWGKWSKEFSDKTNFDKLPDEKEIEEIVDNHGNYQYGKLRLGDKKNGITSDSTTDDVVKSGAGSMGKAITGGGRTTLRYWAESDMSKALGYEETLGNDEDYDDAKQHFEKELGLDEPETEDRLAQMGYDKKLPKDKVRLVENPKKFIKEYINSVVLPKKNDTNDIIKKKREDVNEINPIIKKQLNSLKTSIKNNNLSLDDVMKHLKDDE